MLDNSIDPFQKYLDLNLSVARQIPLEEIDKFLSCLDEVRQKKGTLWVVGNGGSASTASHFAVDFMKTIEGLGGELPLKTISLSDSITLLTAISNDVDYSESFSAQLQTLASADDALLCISVSGKSPNIIKAISKAREINCRTFAILGQAGTELRQQVDYSIIIPSFDYQIVENLHVLIMHWFTKRFAAK